LACSGAGDTGLTFKPVAVVRKDNTKIKSLEDLEGARSCHTGVGRAAGWVYPVAELIDAGVMGIAECNVPVKSADAFFQSMCAPGGLARFYNPFGEWVFLS
jgi:melanoma-associated antigen p97